MKNIAKYDIIPRKRNVMSVAKQIRTYIDNIDEGKIFTYADLPVENISAAAPLLSRMEKKGEIARLSKGKYYKPKQGRFGALLPSDDEVLKSYLKNIENAYLTGLKAFNQMGLTTQVPNIVSIAGKGSARKIEIKNMTIKILEQTSSIKPDDIWLAQMLDALNMIKKIPDTTPDDVINYTKNTISTLERKEIKRLASLANEYRPRTRAILGSILKGLGYDEWANSLKSTLNPLTSYKVGLSENILENKKEWKIL